MSESEKFRYLSCHLSVSLKVVSRPISEKTTPKTVPTDGNFPLKGGRKALDSITEPVMPFMEYTSLWTLTEEKAAAQIQECLVSSFGNKQTASWPVNQADEGREGRITLEASQRKEDTNLEKLSLETGLGQLFSFCCMDLLLL